MAGGGGTVPSAAGGGGIVGGGVDRVEVDSGMLRRDTKKPIRTPMSNPSTIPPNTWHTAFADRCAIGHVFTYGAAVMERWLAEIETPCCSYHQYRPEISGAKVLNLPHFQKMMWPKWLSVAIVEVNKHVYSDDSEAASSAEEAESTGVLGFASSQYCQSTSLS